MDYGYLDMNIEERLVLFVIQKIVYPNENDEGIGQLLSSQAINWQRVKELMIYHEVVPFAYVALKNCSSLLPQDLAGFLKNTYYCTFIRDGYLRQEFLKISDACTEKGIVLVPIKGIALLEDIYANRPLRSMTDIDVLIKEDDLSKAEAVFCDLGYRKELYGLREEYWRKNQCHIAFYKKEEEGKAPFVELHWSLDFKRKNRNILSELWSRIRGINLQGRILRLLSVEDTLFSLALHSRRLGKTLCLKNVYDAALILNKYTGNFDWDYVLRESEKSKMCSTIFFLLSQVMLLSDAPIPCLLYTSPSPRDGLLSRMPSSA